MLEELRSGRPREQSYWAQQIAFAPVLVHALCLSLRGRQLSETDRNAVVAAVVLALRALEALPDVQGLEPSLLAIMAHRQARAITWGRRRTLRRLLQRLDAVTQGDSGCDATRLLRPYPLLGWSPESRLSA